MTATAPGVTTIKKMPKVTAEMEAALAKVNERYASRFLVFGFKTEPDGTQVWLRRQHGPHASDRRPLGVGITLIPTDVIKFVEANETGEENLIGALDGSSWRVKLDDLARDFYEAGKKVPDQLDELCDGAWSRVQGIRGSRGPRAHALPDGNKYVGNDIAEFRAAYAKAMELEGANAEFAQKIAARMMF